MAALNHLRSMTEIPQAYLIETIHADIVDSVLRQPAGPAHVVEKTLIGCGAQQLSDDAQHAPLFLAQALMLTYIYSVNLTGFHLYGATDRQGADHRAVPET